MTADPRETLFGVVADTYDRFRSSPAPVALDWLLPPGARDVVDLGAGSGQLTRALVERGVNVTAVEPDARMRTALEARVPSAAVLTGSPERLPVADRSQDAILAHASWHWFDHKAALAEAARVLRPGGHLGVLGTRFDPDCEWLGDLWTALDPGARAHRIHLPRPGWLQRPERNARPFAASARAWFQPAEGLHVARFSRRVTADDVLGLARTYSGVILQTPIERASTLERVQHAVNAMPEFASPDGREVPMVTRSWRAARR